MKLKKLIWKTNEAGLIEAFLGKLSIAQISSNTNYVILYFNVLVDEYQMEYKTKDQAKKSIENAFNTYIKEITQ